MRVLNEDHDNARGGAMSLKIFYAASLFVLAAVIALSLAWEFWLEDWLLPSLVSHHEKESWENRWEFVVTTASFAAIALIVPAILGTQIIRRDQVLRLKMIRLSQEDHLTGLFNPDTSEHPVVPGRLSELSRHRRDHEGMRL